MKTVLIVSSTDDSILYFTQVLTQNFYEDIVSVKNCGEARRMLIQRDFDLYIINTPLPDEFGEKFALDIAENGISQVILVVRSELLEEVSSKVEDMGVFTISKPIGKGVLWSALKLVNAAYLKMAKLSGENKKLLQKIDDMRIIDRAKYILISSAGLTEGEAHRQIEKKAMDMRTSKKDVAQRIISNYREL